MPADDTPSKIPDGLLHFAGNCLLIGSAYVAVFDRFAINRIFIVCIVLSLVSETGQNFSHSRVFDPADLAMNGLGLIVGYLICRTWHNVVGAARV
ncbi:MAG: VanZ family protein [Agarilytica sp.]